MNERNNQSIEMLIDSDLLPSPNKVIFFSLHFVLFMHLGSCDWEITHIHTRRFHFMLEIVRNETSRETIPFSWLIDF